MRAKQIRRIVIHCTAGYGSVAAVKRYWFNVLKWKTGGYHVLIDLEGYKHQLYPFEKIVNGAKGFNADSIHIAYVGGVERSDYSKAADTRTTLQEIMLEQAIIEALDWLELHGADTSSIEVVGHRDLSPDLNGNGTIETWERTKECPSFDAILEYKHLTDNYVV